MAQMRTVKKKQCYSSKIFEGALSTFPLGHAIHRLVDARSRRDLNARLVTAIVIPRRFHAVQVLDVTRTILNQRCFQRAFLPNIVTATPFGCEQTEPILLDLSVLLTDSKCTQCFEISFDKGVFGFGIFVCVQYLNVIYILHFYTKLMEEGVVIST